VHEPTKEHQAVDINMVFHIPVEFGLPEPEITRMELDAARAVFEKLETLGGRGQGHMKP
jgi:hypothetical protein